MGERPTLDPERDLGISPREVQTPEQLAKREQKWEATRQEVREMSDRLGEKVDSGIEETVVALNVSGIRTNASCEGHAERDIGAPWVDIAADPDMYEEQHEGENEMIRQVAERHGIDPNELWVPENRAAEEEYGQRLRGLPLTPEFKAWAEENKQLAEKLQTLLDEFYQDRDVPEAQRLAIEKIAYFYRLHNGGEDYRTDTGELTDEERETLAQRLPTHQAEMEEFAAFLKERLIERAPKTPEERQAQVAAFAAERIEHHEDRKHVFDNLDAVASGDVEDVARITSRAEYHKDEDGNTVRVVPGTKRTVATGKEYLDFLRAIGGSRYEGIQGRTEILQKYSEFAPLIDALRKELPDPAKRKEHPTFIGNGSNSKVFSITHEGTTYAVRIPNGKRVNPSVVDSHLAGALLGKDMPHMEQIVAASYEDGVTVAEMIPGVEMGDLNVEDVRQITDDQLRDLVDTVVKANEKGIEIDPKPSNFLYDRDKGFGVADYHSSRVIKNSADQDPGTVVGWMSTVITNAGFYGRGSNPEMTVEDYARDRTQHVANLKVLERFRSIVEERLKGDQLQIALSDIDKRIVSYHDTISRYGDADWVADQIEAEAKRQREIKQHKKSKTRDFDDWTKLPVDVV